MAAGRQQYDSPEFDVEVWERAHAGDADALDELARGYAPLVYRAVAKLSRSLPDHIHAEDLLSSGFMGFHRALSKYTEVAWWRENSSPFEPYALLSIRSVVLDDIRAQDWAPRSLRKKQKDLALAEKQFASDNDGRLPSDTQVAEMLGCSRQDVVALRKQVESSHHLSLNELTEEAGDRSDILSAPSDEVSREDLHTVQSVLSGVIDRVTQLPVLPQAVLALHYFENLNFSAIAQQLGVSEVKVSAVHRQAILAVRETARELAREEMH